MKATDPMGCLLGKEGAMQWHGQIWSCVLHRCELRGRVLHRRVLKEARPPPSPSLAPGRPSLSVLQESSEHDLGGVGSDGGREIWGCE